MNERRSRNLDSVLAAAAAPPLPEEEDERALATVLTMFNTAGIAADAGVATTEPITAHSPIEPLGEPDLRPSRRATTRFPFVAKAAVVLAAFVGTTIGVASTGILPSPVQSFVHNMFGGIGVPGPTPDSSAPSTNASASATPSPLPSPGPDSPASSSAAGRGGPGATSSSGPGASSASPNAAEASLYTLCTQVKGSGNSWKTTMSAQDQARLVAAAGGEKKVHAYCNALLNSGADATPSSGTSGSTDTTTPSPSPTKTKGKGNANGNGNGTSDSATQSGVAGKPGE